MPPKPDFDPVEDELLNLTEAMLGRLVSRYKRKPRRGRALDRLRHLEHAQHALTLVRLNPATVTRATP